MRKFPILFVRAFAALSLLAFAACSIPIPQAETDPTRYYLLAASATPPTPPAANAPTVHLRAIDLANYLRARPLIVRRGDNEIQFREFARWGEPLDLGLGRVLREELLARGAVSAVVLRAGPATYTHELAVRVLACEGGADGTVIFRAVWEISTIGTQPAVVARGDYRAADLRWDAQGEGSLAAQLSVAVAGLATEISAALKK
jgi:uncharacterized protein